MAVRRVMVGVLVLVAAVMVAVLPHTLTPDKQDIYITVNISEGSVYKVTDIKLAGELLVQEDELRRLITIKPGDTFSRDRLTESFRIRLSVVPRVGANCNFIAERRRRPIAYRQGTVRARFVNRRSLKRRVLLRFPRSIHSPHAAELSDSRRGERERDPRPFGRPPPADQDAGHDDDRASSRARIASRFSAAPVYRGSGPSGCSAAGLRSPSGEATTDAGWW